MSSPAPKALVTGGARRLGRQIVESLAEKGFEVAIHCNQSIEAAEALVAGLRERYNRDFFAIQANLMLPGAGMWRVRCDRWQPFYPPEVFR